LKLVFLGPTYPFRGGIARYGTHLLAALQKRHDCLGMGFEKLYPAFLFPGQSQLDSDAEPPGAFQVDRILHYAQPAAWREAARRIADFQPDGILLFWWVTFWAPHYHWLTRRLTGRRFVFLCHNVLPHEKRFFDPPLVRWALRGAHGFIVHSEENRRQLLGLFPDARILHRAHPVYDLDDARPIGLQEARTRLHLTGRMLLFFGFVRAYKGLDVAIEALSLVKSHLPDLTLWICGEFWDDRRKYERLIAKHQLEDRIRIEAHYLPQTDLALRIAACDGVILPYRTATGSGILGNAFAMGKPVIATRTGSLGEMVEHGQSGLLCEPNDPAALAQAMRDFFAAPGPQRFEDGVAAAKTQFTWDAIVSAVEELVGRE
jgi:glycosyltransferase involved in cell wall biosynthesis